MTPTPYLFFNGQCAEAIAAYAEIFGGEILEQLPAAQLPPEYTPPKDRMHWIMHARVKIGDGVLMASDNIMGDTPAMAGASVMVSLPQAPEARAAFDKLAEGGEVQMPFAPTFWSAGFGTLIDRFGIRWMIGCDEAPAG